ncbi:TAP-like protein-domain-containing protein [Cristinia sonorae]|uniref:TAP-like protein-domain-containing protein n=1 Tax=Cristinia sonorae TaxID=1940300 RepID=A0A8K0XRU3_9AGAR|nr:TAP-like protein-domain-containing protein [Cristinia sonorae]
MDEEKAALAEIPLKSSPRHLTSKLFASLAAFCLAGLILASDRRPSNDYPQVPLQEPVGTVNISPCPDQDDLPGSKCGYIVVPKDYNDPSAGVAKIAVGILPALTSTSKGSVFFNPGGPGGAAKQRITKRGDSLRAYVGDDYDIVAFDPRGIGETLPATKCFFDFFSYGDFKRNTVLERSYEFASNFTPEELRSTILLQQRETHALLETVFETCRVTMGEELKYMGTTTVVRDIDFMTKALDGPDALINYYGGSYGSVLGQYLVNMLPDRVGRVAIDGIVDAKLWADKPPYQWYSQWLVETDNAYGQFYTGCSESGPIHCPLAEYQGEDPAKIRTRVESFIDSLYYQPIPAPFAKIPRILTSGRAKWAIQFALLVPSWWPKLSVSLTSAMNGDPADLLNNSDFYLYRDLERNSVTCNDVPKFAPPSAEEVTDELLNVYQNVSRFVFSVVTSEPDSGCQYWPVTPPERFTGPWNNTLRNPMLILSSTADPVTPMASALKVQARLGDSARLLLQDGPGHATSSLPSLCTSRYARAYFTNGTLPPKDARCKPDFTPFPSSEVSISRFSREEYEILDRISGLNEILLHARGNSGW